MLEKVWKKVYPYIFKNPCNTCIVQATCKNKGFLFKPCDVRHAWWIRRYKGKLFCKQFETVLFLILIYIALLLIFATFVLGIWKWIDIIIIIFK